MLPDLRRWPKDPEEQYAQAKRRLDRTMQYPGSGRPRGTPRPSKRMAVVPKPDNNMFVPTVPLDPSMVTDRRGVIDFDKVVFWVGQWWNDVRPKPRPIVRNRKRAPVRIERPNQRYADEANQPARVTLPIPRAKPQRR